MKLEATQSKQESDLDLVQFNKMGVVQSANIILSSFDAFKFME